MESQQTDKQVYLQTLRSEVMKSINEAINKKPTEYIPPDKRILKRGESYNLTSCDREYYYGFIERCKRCKGHKHCPRKSQSINGNNINTRS